MTKMSPRDTAHYSNDSVLLRRTIVEQCERAEKAERERDAAIRAVVDEGRLRGKAESERDEARALASEAIEEVEQWGAYAPEWAKDKWDFTETLDNLRNRLWKDRTP